MHTCAFNINVYLYIYELCYLMNWFHFVPQRLMIVTTVAGVRFELQWKREMDPCPTNLLTGDFMSEIIR